MRRQKSLNKGPLGFLLVVLVILYLVTLSSALAIDFAIVDAREAANWAKDHSKIFGALTYSGPAKVARDSLEILAEAQDTVRSALSGIVYSLMDKAAHEAADYIAAPIANLKSGGKLEDLDKVPGMEPGSADAVMLAMPKSLVGFLAFHGTMTSKRYWIIVDKYVKIQETTTTDDGKGGKTTTTKTVEKGVFLAIPGLVKSGKHGALVMAFKESIGATLKEEDSSKMIDFVRRKSQKWNIRAEMFFSKAIHLDGAGITPKSPEHRAWKADFDAVIKAMMNNKKDSAILPDPQFFV